MYLCDHSFESKISFDLKKNISKQQVRKNNGVNTGQYLKRFIGEYKLDQGDMRHIHYTTSTSLIDLSNFCL